MAERERTTSGGPRIQLELELQRPAPAHQSRTEDLCVCPTCSGEFVHPLEWEPCGANAWYVKLRCPECEWRGSGVYGQDLVDRFDDVLDEGTEAVLDDLERLTRANDEEEIELFVDALQRDLILPEDF